MSQGYYQGSASGYDAWLPSVSLEVRVSTGSQEACWSGLYINVRRCGGLSIVILQLKGPLGTIREEKGISSRLRVSISSRYTLESDVKPFPAFLLSFLGYDGPHGPHGYSEYKWFIRIGFYNHIRMFWNIIGSNEIFS